MADPSHHRRIMIGAVLALGLVGLGVYTVADDHPAPEAASGKPACGPVLREPVGGASRHIDEGALDYEAAPPAFGDHRSRWEVGALPFYDVDDRPPVEVLVHNLEHGYNILWYDPSIRDDALDSVQEIAREYASLTREPDPDTAFIAVPWTEQDGAPFPDRARYALTHWYFDADDPAAAPRDEVGLTRYCTEITADVVRDWMRAYPLRDAPEGFRDLM